MFAISRFEIRYSIGFVLCFESILFCAFFLCILFGVLSFKFCANLLCLGAPFTGTKKIRNPLYILIYFGESVFIVNTETIKSHQP